MPSQYMSPCADPEWGRGQKNHKAIGFLSKTDTDPLENHKATDPAFNVGPSLVVIGSVHSKKKELSWTPSEKKLSESAHVAPCCCIQT